MFCYHFYSHNPVQALICYLAAAHRLRDWVQRCKKIILCLQWIRIIIQYHQEGNMHKYNNLFSCEVWYSHKESGIDEIILQHNFHCEWAFHSQSGIINRCQFCRLFQVSLIYVCVCVYAFDVRDGKVRNEIQLNRMWTQTEAIVNKRE